MRSSKVRKIGMPYNAHSQGNSSALPFISIVTRKHIVQVNVIISLAMMGLPFAMLDHFMEAFLTEFIRECCKLDHAAEDFEDD